MAVVWNTTIIPGSNISGTGYTSPSIGSITDSTADMYGGATCTEIFADGFTGLRLRFVGNVSGSWLSVKIGWCYYAYSSFTRTYDSGSNVTTFTYSGFDDDGTYPIAPSGVETRVTFFDTNVTGPGDYGLQIYDTNGRVSYSNKKAYLNIVASGTASISGNSTSTIFCDNPDVAVLTNLPTVSNIALSLSIGTVTSTYFTIVNASSSIANVSYIAFRRA